MQASGSHQGIEIGKWIFLTVHGLSENVASILTWYKGQNRVLSPGFLRLANNGSQIVSMRYNRLVRS